MSEPITRPYLYLISAKYWCVRIINRPKYLIIAETQVYRAWQAQPDDFSLRIKCTPKTRCCTLIWDASWNFLNTCTLMMWLPDENDLTQVAIFRSCALPQKESTIPVEPRQREIKRLSWFLLPLHGVRNSEQKFAISPYWMMSIRLYQIPLPSPLVKRLLKGHLLECSRISSSWMLRSTFTMAEVNFGNSPSRML